MGETSESAFSAASREGLHKLLVDWTLGNSRRIPIKGEAGAWETSPDTLSGFCWKERGGSV